MEAVGNLVGADSYGAGLYLVNCKINILCSVIGQRFREQAPELRVYKFNEPLASSKVINLPNLITRLYDLITTFVIL